MRRPLEDLHVAFDIRQFLCIAGLYMLDNFNERGVAVNKKENKFGRTANSARRGRALLIND
jgi:hypothetical protein